MVFVILRVNLGKDCKVKKRHESEILNLDLESKYIDLNRLSRVVIISNEFVLDVFS